MTATITTITGQIEERLGDVRRALRVAREAIKEVEAEEKGLTQALRALDPTNRLVAKEVAVEEKPAKPARPARPARPAVQQVSEDLVERVQDALGHASAPITVADIRRRVFPTVSDSAIRSAVQILRDRQKVRLAGKGPGPGAPSLYAPMRVVPEGEYSYAVNGGTPDA